MGERRLPSLVLSASRSWCLAIKGCPNRSALTPKSKRSRRTVPLLPRSRRFVHALGRHDMGLETSHRGAEWAPHAFLPPTAVRAGHPNHQGRAPYRPAQPGFSQPSSGKSHHQPTTKPQRTPEHAAAGEGPNASIGVTGSPVRFGVMAGGEFTINAQADGRGERGARRLGVDEISVRTGVVAVSEVGAPVTNTVVSENL